MNLSIIIVSWNTRDLLINCLASVLAHPPHVPYEVWVVDNASSDDSVAMLYQQFPQVHLIENDKNAGFAGANNQAIKQCSGQYILLLNPDTVVQPMALQSLVEFMDAKPEAGAAGSRLLNPDGSLQSSCHPMPTLSRELWRLFHLDVFYPYGLYRMHKWGKEKAREVDVLQGASLLLRRNALDEVGLLDESYFMYSEEVDLCRRLQQAGWHLYWVPQSQVIHFGGQSAQQVAAEMFLQLYQNKLYYFRKHEGKWAARVYRLILLAAAGARLSLAPFIWLQRSPHREGNLRLARYYLRLFVVLLQRK